MFVLGRLHVHRLQLHLIISHTLPAAAFRSCSGASGFTFPTHPIAESLWDMQTSRIHSLRLLSCDNVSCWIHAWLPSTKCSRNQPEGRQSVFASYSDWCQAQILFNHRLRYSFSFGCAVKTLLWELGVFFDNGRHWDSSSCLVHSLIYR